MNKEKIKKLDGRTLFGKVSELKDQGKITRDQIPAVFGTWLKENGYIVHRIFGWLSPQEQSEVKGMKLVNKELIDRPQLGKVHSTNPEYFRWNNKRKSIASAKRFNTKAMKNMQEVFF